MTRRFTEGVKVSPLHFSQLKIRSIMLFIKKKALPYEPFYLKIIWSQRIASQNSLLHNDPIVIKKVHY